MKKRTLTLILTGLLLLGVTSASILAQDEPTSNVQIFYVACENQGVIELSGEMQSGYDVYFQLFSAAEGTGVPLTGLRRVQVSGSYVFSEVVAYSEGLTVPVGSVGSVYVAIARESDSSRTIYETNVNDYQDGCAEPQTPPGTSSDVGEATEADSEAEVAVGSGILTPFGTELNPGYVSEPLVKIGARTPVGRTANPGLIFAECDKYPAANPGILYDTDEIIIYWSWFAKTAELVQEHIDHATYVVTLNGEFFPYVERSEITKNNGDYWVFYTARVGNNLNLRSYGIVYDLSWDMPISDGYDDYGPSTAHEREYSTCTFEIQANPWEIYVNHIDPPTVPLSVILEQQAQESE